MKKAWKGNQAETSLRVKLHFIIKFFSKCGIYLTDDFTVLFLNNSVDKSYLILIELYAYLLKSCNCGDVVSG
ncbi:hypothetical protein NIES4074_28290 [Cylindrospermum sp. NIES-4074]|nr:hypothetical protein NIES4074_28290 [Cylindrospermum sp. NIES-4074]